MDFRSAEANVTTLADQAAKGVLHALWTQTAAHPRLATVIALCAVATAFGAGVAVGAGG